MESQRVINCDSVTSRTDFKSYIHAIRQLPGNTSLSEIEAAHQCKAEICGALWGFGNPDIEGVGMIAGYIMSNALGLFLCLLLFAFRHSKYRKALMDVLWWFERKVLFCWKLAVRAEDRKPKSKGQWHKVLTGVFQEYFNNALLLAASIQVAATITLAKLSFGISANGMGDTSARITWAVSNITMVPLLYFVFLPKLCSDIPEEILEPLKGDSRSSIGESGSFEDGSNLGEDASLPKPEDSTSSGLLEPQPALDNVDPESTLITQDETPKEPTETRAGTSYSRETFDFALFVGCWTLSLFPFISRIISTYGYSEIGQDKVITSEEFKKITAPCYDGVDLISEGEHQVMFATGVAISVIILVMTLTRSISMTMQRARGTEQSISRHPSRRIKGSALRAIPTVISLLVLLELTIVQFWAIFRLRRLQQQMARAAGGNDTANSWTFGQIIAMTLFLPVLINGFWKWKEP